MYQQEQQHDRLSSYNLDSVQDNIQEREARPYYWSTKPNTGNVPKNEHPANFEDSIAGVPPIPPYSYQAQDRPAQNTQNNMYNGKPFQTQARPSGLSPDGDAMEHGYRPYKSYNIQVPPWARPQSGNKAGRIALFVVLGLFLAKPLLILLGVLLGAFIVFASAALIVFFIVAGFALVSLFIVFALLGRRPFGAFHVFQPRRWRSW